VVVAKKRRYQKKPARETSMSIGLNKLVPNGNGIWDLNWGKWPNGITSKGEVTKTKEHRDPIVLFDGREFRSIRRPSRRGVMPRAKGTGVSGGLGKEQADGDPRKPTRAHAKTYDEQFREKCAMGKKKKKKRRGSSCYRAEVRDGALRERTLRGPERRRVKNVGKSLAFSPRGLHLRNEEESKKTPT